MQYIPGPFASLSKTPLGLDLWAAVRAPEYVAALETATRLGHPAVKGVEDLLLRDFGDKVFDHRVKQMIGHMVKQIMDAAGYEIDQQKVKMESIPFYAGTRYKRRDDRTYHVWHKGSDVRSCALTPDKLGSKLPPLTDDRWIYYRAFSGWLRGSILFQATREHDVRESIQRLGYCLVHMPRMLRAA